MIIGKAHILEGEFALAQSCSGVAPGLSLISAFTESSGNMLFHIDQALLDFAVGRADEVQRHVELDHQRIDHHEVADGGLALATPQRPTWP